MIYEQAEEVVIHNKHHPWYGEVVIVVGGWCPIGGQTTLAVQMGLIVKFVAESQVKRYREYDKKVHWSDILEFTPEAL